MKQLVTAIVSATLDLMQASGELRLDGAPAFAVDATKQAPPGD